jgi:hypothetical protein
MTMVGVADRSGLGSFLLFPKKAGSEILRSRGGMMPETYWFKGSISAKLKTDRMYA